MSPSSIAPSPSQPQLRYLRYLAEATGSSFAYPKTQREAREQIDRLLRLKAQTRVVERREPSIATDASVYATAPDAEESTGYGSTAHWRTTPQSETDAVSKSSAFGPLVEIARYTISVGERVVYGQRIQGRVRLTDGAAHGAGARYLIEDDLQRDGYAALLSLVADYVAQARELDDVPALSSLVRRDLRRENS